MMSGSLNRWGLDLNGSIGVLDLSWRVVRDVETPFISVWGQDGDFARFAHQACSFEQ
jgi:hypothetical protein